MTCKERGLKRAGTDPKRIWIKRWRDTWWLLYILDWLDCLSCFQVKDCLCRRPCWHVGIATSLWNGIWIAQSDFHKAPSIQRIKYWLWTWASVKGGVKLWPSRTRRKNIMIETMMVSRKVSWMAICGNPPCFSTSDIRWLTSSYYLCCMTSDYSVYSDGKAIMANGIP